MEVVYIKKFLTCALIINMLISFNTVLATNQGIESFKEELDLNEFIEEIKNYSNEYFPELADEKFLNNLINGNIQESDSNIFEKIFNSLIGEFQANIFLILKIIGIAILCSMLKNIQTNFSETGISDVAFYTCYLIVVTLIITTFTNIITLCGDTVSKLSSFMNMIVPLVFALIAITGNIATISFLQPVIIGMITFIAYLLNKIILPIIYISTIVNIITNISNHIKLEKLSEVFKKGSLWVMEICLLIFIGILSIEGSLSSTVDGMTSKIAKNIVSSTIPVVGKVLGDTVDSVIGGIAITKNAIGFIGVIAILAITVGPLLKSLISMIVFNFASAFIEPITDNRIAKCMSGVADSLKIIVGILAVVIFIFIIAITMMLKISNNALMYK